jgi:hypothetical protein
VVDVSLTNAAINAAVNEVRTLGDEQSRIGECRVRRRVIVGTNKKSSN